MSKGKVAVVTDSSVSLPEELIQSLDIHVIPLWLHWGDDRLRDGIDISPVEFYERLKREDSIPTTSQPSAGEFIEFFQAFQQDYSGVVAVLVSEKLSGTIGSAKAAIGQMMDFPVEVVDSANVSMGLSFPVLAAARAAAEGQTVEQVAAEAARVAANTYFLFVVDTLEYLHKGGRITGAKALLGTALSIKPLLHFEDGLIAPLAQVRTKKKGIATMLDQAAERLAGKRMAAVGVVDSNVPAEGDKVAGMVQERFGVTEVLREMIGPVVGTHAGPGAVGLAFYPED
ncbi:MAG TPA: DegV family protein [Anaerolineales bacterium]|nr:DegV family protein [Anaerolineales bacterium]